MKTIHHLYFWHFHCLNNDMKENCFYVILSIRTSNGFENFGKFDLSCSRKVAEQIFGQFKGTAKVDEQTPLTIELMETVNELPSNLNVLSCTLEDLAHNTKLIAREIFKIRNL